jgi:putative ABC transport system ATP-binding protein
MLIRIKNLDKTYDGDVTCHALRDVSIDIRKGDFVVVVGRSGSGKSTLLNCMAGLDIPQSGEVMIDDMSIYELSEDQRAVYRREYIGLIFQQYHLIPIMNSIENVLVPMGVGGSEGVDEKARLLLERLGLEGKGGNIPTQLSGGESQRVAIARALINDPVIILADEPTGNLDYTTGLQIMELLAELNKEGQTIVMVTHNLEYTKYGNRVIHMEDGRIVKTERR